MNRRAIFVAAFASRLQEVDRKGGKTEPSSSEYLLNQGIRLARSQCMIEFATIDDITLTVCMIIMQNPRLVTISLLSVCGSLLITTLNKASRITRSDDSK